MIFSGRLLLELSKKASSKEEAYQIVQDNAMKAWRQNESFSDLIRNDKRVKKYLTGEEIEECFSLRYYLRNIDYVFKRVFGRKGRAAERL
jgi:adenylosuccinate lyase